MKNELHKHLKFRIGEETYKNEFKLITLGRYCCKKYCYDVSEFRKDLNEKIFDLVVEKIILYYNADILTKIEYYFNSNLYTRLLVIIKQFLGSPYQEIANESMVYNYWHFGKYYLILEKKERNKTMILSYQKRKNLKNILNTDIITFGI